MPAYQQHLGHKRERGFHLEKFWQQTHSQLAT